MFSRLSRNRRGGSGWKRPPLAPNQPVTSKMTCAEPAPLAKASLPPVPSLEVAATARVSPAATLTVDVPARDEPAGPTAT
jgi:hypothetical protein